MAKQRFWIVVGLAFLLIPNSFAEPAPVDQLIQQLGSAKFSERQAAAREIYEIGPPALDPLQKAVQHPDAEIRRRADSLVKAIKLRADAETAFQPTRIKLDYADTAVLDAIADLSKRTGYAINFLGDKKKLADRKISLQTPELPFWEALDRLCDKAALSVRFTPNLAVTSQPATNNGGWVVGGGFPGGVTHTGVPSVPNAIQLADSKPSQAHIVYAGALRIRLLSPDDKNLRNTATEAAYTVEVSPEPKVRWYGLTGVRVEEALDANGQLLSLALPKETQPAIDAEEQALLRGVQFRRRAVRGGVIIQNGNLRQLNVNGVWLGDSWDDSAGRVAGPRQWPIRLKLPENAGQTLKHLKATILARVQLPMELVIDNVMQSENKQHTAADGSRITLTSVAKQENGDVLVRAKLIPSPSILQTNLNANLQLFDTGGKAYQMKGSPDIGFGDNLGASFHVQATFTAPAMTANAQKLTWSSSRMAVIEVPFELKDVPLLAKE